MQRILPHSGAVGAFEPRPFHRSPARIHHHRRRVDRGRQVPGGLFPLLFLVFMIVTIVTARKIID
jgi:hypothetical protein